MELSKNPAEKMTSGAGPAAPAIITWHGMPTAAILPRWPTHRSSTCKHAPPEGTVSCRVAAMGSWSSPPTCRIKSRDAQGNCRCTRALANAHPNRKGLQCFAPTGSHSAVVKVGAGARRAFWCVAAGAWPQGLPRMPLQRQLPAPSAMWCSTWPPHIDGCW